MSQPLVLSAVSDSRLDMAIAALAPEISRREARRLIAAGAIVVNGRPVSVASRLLHTGDRIAIVPDDIHIDVIAERKEWIAIDKPPGIATQPAGAKAGSALSLVEILAVSLRRQRKDFSLFVIHRIDTGTSGVVLFARTRVASARLSRLFAGGELRKRYLGLVTGRIDEEIRIDRAIRRAGSNVFETADSGRPATTIVIPRAASDYGSLVELDLLTGRTHQIRVHLASIGHPIIGDRKYGSAPAPPADPKGELVADAGVDLASSPDSRARPRQSSATSHPAFQSAARPMLHAWTVSHPEIGTLVAPIPEDFRATAERLGLPLANALGEMR